MNYRRVLTGSADTIQVLENRERFLLKTSIPVTVTANQMMNIANQKLLNN